MRVGTGEFYNTAAPKARINMTLNEDLVLDNARLAARLARLLAAN